MESESFDEFRNISNFHDKPDHKQFLGLGINLSQSEKEKLFLTDHAENADLLDLGKCFDGQSVLSGQHLIQNKSALFAISARPNFCA